MQTHLIKRALISVADKKNLIQLAQGLIALDIEIIATGNTSQLLQAAQLPVRDVSSLTGFPEIMDGRVKTLHPLIHGGILGKRDVHHDIAKEHRIEWIDLVIVNLYPFAETIKKPQVTYAEAIENIDIGGPALIRAAAKNMDWVGVVTNPEDYIALLQELNREQGLTWATRKQLAAKAFQHTADYDAFIFHYIKDEPPFSADLHLHLKKYADLRYGENPHQKASAYQFMDRPHGILSARQHQGKPLSYNNIADADAAFACVREFTEPACVIVKHANPCGAALGVTITEAFENAWHADSKSAFGGIVALNQTCTKKIAEHLIANFIEVLIAPAYEQAALDILANKLDLRVLELQSIYQDNQLFKFIEGGLLIQDRDEHHLDEKELKVVTDIQPTLADIRALLFSWRVLKHIKSNAILIAKENVTVGVGAGQVSRVDAVDLALHKAGKNQQGAVLASDAFFPFRDSIDRLAHTGIRAIIQPGGSIRDEEVISACNEHQIAMLFTGKRCFKH